MLLLTGVYATLMACIGIWSTKNKNSDGPLMLACLITIFVLIIYKLNGVLT